MASRSDGHNDTTAGPPRRRIREWAMLLAVWLIIAALAELALRIIDFRVLRDFADRHTPEAVAREMILCRVENALAHVGRGVVFQRPAAARPPRSPGTFDRHVSVLVALHFISLNDEYLTARPARRKLILIIN